MNRFVKLSSPATHDFWEIPVLFQDDDLLALDKPPGLLTSPDRHDLGRPSLMKLLHKAIQEQKPWARELGITYLTNAHRLDSEVSGALLLARSKSVLVSLANTFGGEGARLEYLALVNGVPAESEFEVDAKLGPTSQPGVMRVDQRRGKRSRTRVKVEEAFGNWSLVRCEPYPGRVHQVRVHLRHAGFPLIGDETYGGRTLFLSRIKRDYRLKPGHQERPLLVRVALHVQKLTVPHPAKPETTVSVEAAVPREFQVALKYLRKYAGAKTGAATPETGESEGHYS